MDLPGVEFEHDGKSFKLRLGTNALIRIQRVLGVSSDQEFLRLLGEVATDAAIRAAGAVPPHRATTGPGLVEIVRALYHSAMTPALATLDDAGDFIDALGFERACELAGTCLGQAFASRVAKKKEGASEPAAPFPGTPS